MTADRERSRRIATGLGLAAACLAFAYAGGLLAPGDWAKLTLSKTLFPAMALIGAAVAGLLVAAGAAKREPEALPVQGHVRAVGMAALALAYAVALPTLGLVVSTVGLCAALLVVLGYRNWIGAAAFTASIILLTWFVFIYLMNVPLHL